MKKVFFDIDNGAVISPRNITAPEYYATVGDDTRVKEIYTCFSKYKLESYGHDWKNDMIHKECFEWVNFKWLMKSLKQYILLNARYSDKDDYDEEYKEQYTYLRFWQSEN